MSELSPGKDGDPLPAAEWVIRMARPSKDGNKPHVAMFELSSEDKRSVAQRLSVWAEKLTTDREAWELTDSDPVKTLVLRLDVDEVRKLRPRPDDPKLPYLDVEWEPLTVRDDLGEERPDPQPGAAGHAGIRYLREGNSIQRRSLRSQLADLASQAGVRILPLDSDL